MTIHLLSKIRLLCLFVILLLFANRVDACSDSLKQIWTNITQPDSIRFNAINEYYKENLFAQPDSVILLTAYHDALANQKDSREERAKAINRRGVAYSIKGDYDKALIEMYGAIDIYSSINDSTGLIKMYNNIANIYTYTAQYQKAINLFSKCLVFYQDNKVDHLAAAVLMNIGLIHLDISNYDKALDYFNKSLDLYKKLGIDHKVGKIWISTGSVNLAKKNYQEALKNSQKALKILQPRNQQHAIASCYILNTRIYKAINQIDSAFIYLNKGLKLHQTIGANLLVLEDQILLAQLVFPTDVNRAMQIGEEVLKSAEGYHDHSMKVELLSLIHI